MNGAIAAVVPPIRPELGRLKSYIDGPQGRHHRASDVPKNGVAKSPFHAAWTSQDRTPLPLKIHVRIEILASLNTYLHQCPLWQRPNGVDHCW